MSRKYFLWYLFAFAVIASVVVFICAATIQIPVQNLVHVSPDSLWYGG